LWGAPSHLDTFDPKPKAPTEYRGPFSPIATRTPGVQFTELVPRIAARSELFALVRSNKTFDGGHPQAGTLGLTGYKENDREPHFGAIAARQRGYGKLPPFISVGRGVPRDVVKRVDGYGGAKWGPAYDPLLIGCSETGQVDVPYLKLIDGLRPERLADRRLLLGELDRVRREVPREGVGSPFRGGESSAAPQSTVATKRASDPLAPPPAHRQWNAAYDRAYELLTSPEAQRALDLSREAGRTREAYGQTTFGQSLLLGRRLVEAGVPFVQVNWSQYVEAATPNCDFGWDTHIFNFSLLPDRHCPIFDRAFAALLDDLKERGLLETTLVVCMGEFGRTPRINNRASRDHWPRCYFSIWAGAGVRGGRVIGESDKLGEDPLTEPITPPMVGTTMVDALGVGTIGRTELRVLDGGRVIHELF
jgi:hypothetical protein